VTDDLQDLARRAVACPGWRWMGGARWIGVRPAPFENLCGRYPDSDRGYRIPHDEPIPDLTDAATLGCLLALVREAWGDGGMTAQHHPLSGKGMTWRVWRPGDPVAYGPTEAAALVAALEAAPVGAG